MKFKQILPLFSFCLVMISVHVICITQKEADNKLIAILKDRKKSVSLKEVQDLVKSGANVNTVSGNDTPLKLAASRSNLTIVHYLLDAGAEVNKIAGNESALFDAIRSGNLNIVNALIIRGADINARGAQNKTALEFATQLANEKKPKNEDFFGSPSDPIEQLLQEKAQQLTYPQRGSPMRDFTVPQDLSGFGDTSQSSSSWGPSPFGF